MNTNSDLLAGFETVTCGRCGGSGRHSYNQIDGDRCYGCSGSGIVLTKRGVAAKAFLSELRAKAASEITVGMFIKIQGYRKFQKVLAINPSLSCSVHTVDGVEVRNYYTTLETKVCNRAVFADTKIEAVSGNEELESTRAAALQFQATLAKTGKPFKKKEMAVA